MASTRIEMDMTKFLSVRIATAAAHVIKAKDLFTNAKLVLDSAGVAADQAYLTGLTEAQATALYTVISNAVANVGTAVTEMRKIEAGIEV
jgi:hypothetical protein